MANGVFDKNFQLLLAASMLVFALAKLTNAQEAQVLQPEVQTSQETEIPEKPIEEPPLSPFSLQLKTILATGLMAVKGEANAERFEGIAAHYRQKNFEPIWIVDNRPTQKARDAVNVLQNANLHGLDPQDYDSEALYQMLGALDLDSLVDLEMRMTRSVVAYAQHLNAGRLNPQSVNREIVVFPQAAASSKILEKLRITNSIGAYLRFMAPYTPRYERLRVALGNYKLIASNGGWTTIVSGETLKPGMSDPRIISVRKRMVEDGARDLDESQGEIYDETLVAAVKNFQIRHGLAHDGVVGSRTLVQMNVPVEDRIRTMEINLERRRWMQNNYGRYYVFVNLADQVIKLVRDEKNVHFEIIQVGKPYFRTPVFSEEMEYLELNPYWNVPYSIATNEYLPKLKSNPGILNAQNIQVLAEGRVINASSVPWNSYSKGKFPVRLRQAPGKGNALGRVKFMFPNKFNVYIHDTPSKANFKKASRYFSHGCLRLRDPLTMAEKILGAQGWTRAKIDSVIRSGKRTVVKLNQKIPVHVTYLTSWVNRDLSVNFRRDIYGRDKILDLAMQKASAN